ncbi:MAG TPA: AAA family ATPase [Pirellulales bacterium]|nr:AAA family ATPase [Pirellulales bacterium]
MKLIDVRVDGFGVWSGLTLAELSPECTVIYGPNEAGKTTLLQFIRAVLYGFSPQRTARYLPCLNPTLSGTAAGGSLTLITHDEGWLQVQRQVNPQHPLGNVLVQAADGTVQGAAHLHRLLHDVDETMFQNVFAVGLHELQELGTLTDSAAARWLHAVSLGFDRVSLVDVLSELEKSRLRLWSDQPSSQIGQLQARRERLQEELAECSHLSHQLEQVVTERAAADHQIAQLESALIEQESHLRTCETAAAVHEPWHRRHALRARIEALGPAAQWPVDALQRMNRYQSAIRQARRKKRLFARRRKTLGEKLTQMKLSEPLWRQAARIEALIENETWIVSLEQEIRRAEETVQRLTAQRQAQQDRLNGAAPASVGPNAPQPGVHHLQPVDHATWRALRRPAAALSQAKRLAEAEQRGINQQRTTQQNRRREVEQALAARGQKNLTAALDSAGQRVAQLRRRVQLDELIEQLAHTKADLEHAIAGCVQRQILPAWMLFSLGGIFVLGVVLVLGGFLLPGSFTGSLGWPMAWLGLLGTGSAVAAKYTLERSAANQMEASRRQLALVDSQTQQAETERGELDRSLPNGGASLPTLLQAAQQELAKLEELLPLDAQRQAADQAAQEVESRHTQAEQTYQQALENWNAALAAVGLPEDLAAPQVRAMHLAGDRLQSTQQELGSAQSELDRRRRELATFSARLEQVFLAAEILPHSSSASDQLRELRRQLADQETCHRDRQSITQRRQKLRRWQQRLVHRVSRLRRRGSQLLFVCQAANMAEFRRRSAEFSQIAALLAQRDAAAQEIASLLGEKDETAIASFLTNTTAEQLAAQLATSRQRLEEIRRQQQRLFEQRGQQNEQIRLLSSDRRPAVKRFELGHVEQQLSAAINRLHVLTLTHRWLEVIKEHYEHHRQPETLREASDYLAQLTEGRCRRVWTRWGENALLVDDDQGRTLPVEVLSQGTREQLFLSLRLALVGLYARRGVQLPMVLDDVLVNFDTHRAAAAVQVLHNFARRGHQLLVFTCHEHLARLFKHHRMDVRRLPSNHQSGRDEPFELEVEPPPRRSRSRRVREVNETPPAPPPTLPPTSVVTAQAAGSAVSVESIPLARIEAAPLVTVLPFPATVVEPEVTAQPLVPMRVDLPQRTARLSPIMRRWAAEEFSGELDDRVNPLWLLDGIVGEELGSPHSPPNGSLPAAGQHSSSTVRRAKNLRVFADQSSPISVEASGDEGLDV